MTALAFPAASWLSAEPPRTPTYPESSSFSLREVLGLVLFFVTMMSDLLVDRQSDAIAVLRAEWARLDAPLRLQGLVERHLPLKPLNASQYDSLKNLPDRAPALVQPGEPDPIGAMLQNVQASADAPTTTGSVPAQGARR